MPPRMAGQVENADVNPTMCPTIVQAVLITTLATSNRSLSLSLSLSLSPRRLQPRKSPMERPREWRKLNGAERGEEFFSSNVTRKKKRKKERKSRKRQAGSVYLNSINRGSKGRKLHKVYGENKEDYSKKTACCERFHFKREIYMYILFLSSLFIAGKDGSSNRPSNGIGLY